MNRLERTCTLVDVFVAVNGDKHEMTSGEFRKWISEVHVALTGKALNVQPSDVCYNRYTDDRGEFQYDPFCLIYNLETKLYRLVGSHYEYSGPVYHKADSKEPIEVGRWEDGKFIKNK